MTGDNSSAPTHRPRMVTHTVSASQTLESSSNDLFSNITILNNNNTNATSPSISYFQDGSSVAIWQQFTDENNITLVAQVYNSSNAMIGNNTYIAYSPVFGSAKLKTFQDGSYVVVYATLATALSDYRIYAQYFNNAHNKINNPIYLMNSTRYNQGVFDIDVTDSALIIATMIDKNTLTTKKFDNGQQEPIYTTLAPICITQLVSIEIEISPVQDSFVLTWSPLNDQGIFTQRYNVTDGSEVGTLHNIPSIPMFIKMAFFQSGYYMIAWQETESCGRQNSFASFVQVLDDQGGQYGDTVQISGQDDSEFTMELQAMQTIKNNYVALFVTYNRTTYNNISDKAFAYKNYADDASSTLVTYKTFMINGTLVNEGWKTVSGIMQQMNIVSVPYQNKFLAIPNDETLSVSCKAVGIVGTIGCAILGVVVRNPNGFLFCEFFVGIFTIQCFLVPDTPVPPDPVPVPPQPPACQSLGRYLPISNQVCGVIDHGRFNQLANVLSQLRVELITAIYYRYRTDDYVLSATALRAPFRGGANDAIATTIVGIQRLFRTGMRFNVDNTDNPGCINVQIITFDPPVIRLCADYWSFPALPTESSPTDGRTQIMIIAQEIASISTNTALINYDYALCDQGYLPVNLVNKGCISFFVQEYYLYNICQALHFPYNLIAACNAENDEIENLNIVVADLIFILQYLIERGVRDVPEQMIEKFNTFICNAPITADQWSSLRAQFETMSTTVVQGIVFMFNDPDLCVDNHGRIPHAVTHTLYPEIALCTPFLAFPVLDRDNLDENSQFKTLTHEVTHVIGLHDRVGGVHVYQQECRNFATDFNFAQSSIAPECLALFITGAFALCPNDDLLWCR